MLIGLDGLDAVQTGVSVAGAELRIPLGVDRPAGRVVLEAHPIIGSWAGFQSAFAARTEMPGGEYYREIYTRARLNPEVSNEVVFDLAGILTEMGDGLAVSGIVVTAVGGGDRGLDDDALLALGRVDVGTLGVSFRRVNPIPDRGVALGEPASSALID